MWTVPAWDKLTQQEKREAADFGMTPEDINGTTNDVDVWPDNWPYVELFDALATQWNVGPSGPVGLNYAVLTPTFYRSMGFGRDQWAEAFKMIRVMENEALKAMRG